MDVPEHPPCRGGGGGGGVVRRKLGTYNSRILDFVPATSHFLKQFTLQSVGAQIACLDKMPYKCFFSCVAEC